VYPHSTRVDLKTHIGMNEQGQYYRYFVDQGKAHYSGTLSEAQVKQYGYAKALPDIHLAHKAYVIHLNMTIKPAAARAMRNGFINGER
jgi:hypothetical protein